MSEQLATMVTELHRQEKVKKDFVTNGTNLSFENGSMMIARNGAQIKYTPTEHFHNQVSEKLGIPKAYYQKMRSEPNHVGLLDLNVNHWIESQGKNMLVRSFEEKTGPIARAFLSDRYNMIDNYEVLMETLNCIKETKMKVDVVSAELSETRMYLNVTCPEIEIQAKEMLQNYRKSIKVGTGIIAGFTLQNSEVGAGVFHITPRGHVLCCNNGMVMAKDALKRVHLGGKMDELEFSKNDKIVAANIRLIREQVKHAVTQFLSKPYLTKLVDFFTEQGKPEIEAPIMDIMEVIGSRCQFSEERQASILDHFLRGGETRRIGIVNAITEECQKLEDVDERYRTEALSYEILSDFNSIENKAKANAKGKKKK